MTNTITLTDEQYQALQAGNSITIEPPKPKWEPQKGNFYISYKGNIFKDSCDNYTARDFGACYPKKHLADNAYFAMRTHNRLLAYVAEFAPDFEPVWNDNTKLNYYVQYTYKQCEWEVHAACVFRSPGIVYMPKDVAEKLADKLNSGEIAL